MKVFRTKGYQFIQLNQVTRPLFNCRAAMFLYVPCNNMTEITLYLMSHKLDKILWGNIILYAATNLLNNLSEYLRNIETYEKFRSNLKTYIYLVLCKISQLLTQRTISTPSVFSSIKLTETCKYAYV